MRKLLVFVLVLFVSATTYTHIHTNGVNKSGNIDFTGHRFIDHTNRNIFMKGLKTISNLRTVDNVQWEKFNFLPL